MPTHTFNCNCCSCSIHNSGNSEVLLYVQGIGLPCVVSALNYCGNGNFFLSFPSVFVIYRFFLFAIVVVLGGGGRVRYD